MKITNDKILRLLSVITAAAIIFSTVSMTGCDDYSDEDDDDYAPMAARHIQNDPENHDPILKYPTDIDDTRSDEPRDSDNPAYEDTYDASLSGYLGYYAAFLDDNFSRNIYLQFVSEYYLQERGITPLTIQLPHELSFSIDIPDSYSESEADEILYSDPSYLQAVYDIKHAVYGSFYAFIKDFPEVFWLSGGCEISWTINSSRLNNRADYSISTVRFTPKEAYTGAHDDIGTVVQGISNALYYIKASAEDNSRYSLLKAIHDYICVNSEYDHEGLKNSTLGDDRYGYMHSAAPLFKGHGLYVCSGYACAFQILCDYLDIPCIYVSGVGVTTTGDSDNHGWNMVQMEDGKWYAVDVTWDDQESGTEYCYFLAGSSTKGFARDFSSDHIGFGDDYKIQDNDHLYIFYPELSRTAYR